MYLDYKPPHSVQKIDMLADLPQLKYIYTRDRYVVKTELNSANHDALAKTKLCLASYDLSDVITHRYAG